MSLTSSVTGITRALLRKLSTHRILVVLLLALFVAAGSRQVGAFLRVPPIQFGGQNDTEDDLRVCSGMHTIFEEYETIAEVQELYIQQMSAVFSEHERVLSTPSQWKCGAGQTGEPPLPALNMLAGNLPGWSVFPSSSAPAVMRPVTFNVFSAVVAELQREYECKLVELQDRALLEISRNKDRAPGNFCCSGQGCTRVGGVTCVGPVTQDSLCNDQCPVFFTTMDIATRLGPYDLAIGNERQRSRTALERSLYALRAADMHYEVARQLTCYMRASLDLRNELNLAADAISCMPKIWDALTSIHDKKQP